MQVPKVNTNINQTSYDAKKHDRRLKIGVTATSALGVATALAHISKKQGFSLNPSRIAKTPIKDWAIFGLYSKKHPERKLLEQEGEEIIELASASVLGGLLGGIAFDDKKHRKAKLKEAVNQLLGNVLVPIGCVWSASKLYKNQKANILKIVPQIKETGKASKIFNETLKAIPGSVATLAALGCGIFAGNKVSNFINEKIYHKKVERDIKATDFAPHLDDVCLATSMMNKESTFGSLLGRFIPIALLFPGYETGSAQEKN